ncbi:hypothetical protein MK079_05090, partial [Candidatus Gracilibacteria bacterium]|nr:hypothetical protein [Candidatus Gracilibacteria bacterium]
MNTSKDIHTPDFGELKNIVFHLGDRIKEEMIQDLQIEQKSGKELVTRIDPLIEQQARKLIKQQYGNVNFKGEELKNENNGSDITFIIDPLDGTESFIHRDFNTAISIGIEYKGVLVHGIVYDFM